MHHDLGTNGRQSWRSVAGEEISINWPFHLLKFSSGSKLMVLIITIIFQFLVQKQDAPMRSNVAALA